MNIYIWGVTSVGKYAVNNIFDGKKYIKPIAFVDNNTELHHTMVEGIPVISYAELLSRTSMDEAMILVSCRNARSEEHTSELQSQR